MFGLVRHLRGGLGLLAIPAFGGLLASDLAVELDNSLVELGLSGGVVCKRLQVCRRHSIRRDRGGIEFGLGGRGALGGIVSRSNLGVERLVHIVRATVGNGFGKIDPAQTGNRGGRGIAGGSRVRLCLSRCHGGVGIARSLLGHIELRLNGGGIDVCPIGIALGGNKFGLCPALIGTSGFAI